MLAYRMALQRRFKLYLGTECGEYVNNPNIRLTVILNNWTSFGLSNLSILQKKLSRLVTKPTKWHVHPAKTQISLGICPV